VLTAGPTAAPTREDLAEELRLSVTRLARRLRREAPTGLSPSQLSALATVDRHRALTLGELAERERVSPPTVTRVVAKLEEDGLLARTADPEDRRVTRVALTAKGRSLVSASRRRKTEWLTTRIAGLSPDERHRLANALDVLRSLTSNSP
jgi:DNA-binding MarR family transcriptional regulator